MIISQCFLFFQGGRWLTDRCYMWGRQTNDRTSLLIKRALQNTHLSSKYKQEDNLGILHWLFSLWMGKALGPTRSETEGEHPHLQSSWFPHRNQIRSWASQTVTHSASPFTSNHKHTFLQGDSGSQWFLWKWSNWCQLYLRSSWSNAGMPHWTVHTELKGVYFQSFQFCLLTARLNLQLQLNGFLFSVHSTCQKTPLTLHPSVFCRRSWLSPIRTMEADSRTGFSGFVQWALTDTVGLCLRTWDEMLFLHAFSYRSKHT